MNKDMLVYVFETKEWERRYLTEVVKDIELKFSKDRLNKDTGRCQLLAFIDWTG